MISLVRVDNRLIHGQVVEAWLPHLKVDRVAVADDEAASNDLIRAAMGLAVQPSVQVLIQPLGEVAYRAISDDDVPTLLLVRDVGGVVRARAQGLELRKLNLGNVHFSTGRRQISPSVFLSPDELDALRMLSEGGVEVEVRAVPAEKGLGMAEITERFSKAG